MTTTEYSPRARAERVIATGRACLILFAIAGVLLSPSDSETLADEALQLLVVYCVYAVLIWMAIARGALVTRRATSIEHGIDLTIAVILAMLTQGSGSPFFLFFTFLLLAATVRWQARGAWTTGLVVVTAYLAVVTVEGIAYAEPIEVNRFVVRLGLLLVMTMVLGQLGRYQQGLYAELHQLAAWPRMPARTLDEVLRESLAHAARLLNVPVAVLLWQADDMPLNVAVFRDGRLERTEQGGPLEELVLVPREYRSFLHVRGGAGLRTVALTDRPHELTAPVLSGDLVRQLGVETAIGAALPARSHEGWLLLVNRPARTLTTDDVVLAEIAAGDISASVEHWNLSQRARDAAVAEERLRVSRDLHDGVLQSLTACRLNIAAAAAQAESSPQEIAGQLRALERSLAHEQQELREVIQELRGSAAPRERTPLRDLCSRVERQWRITVTVTPGADAVVPDDLNAATLLMVHEALANAVRHGKAGAAHVAVERRGPDLIVRIEDDGHGFPFKGRLQGAELAARGAGPRSLRERAEMLGGMVTVISKETGATVEISIPIARETICV